MRTVPLALLLACLWVSPVRAGDPADASREGALLEAVRASPLSLREAMRPAYGAARRPVAAEFVLGTDDRILLRATVRIQEGENESFESWVGPVHSAGWVPTKRVLEAGAELTGAERGWARMKDDPDLLRRALEGAVRTDERAGPADLALSITTIEEDDKVQASLRIGTDGRVRGLRFDAGTGTYQMTAPTPAPERLAYEAPPLPSFDVVDGTWFNVDEAPTLASWRGGPVLVVITDPG